MVWKSEIGSVRKRKDFFSAHPKVPTTSANKNEIYVLSTFSAFLRIGGNVIDSGANDAPTGSERLLPLDFFLKKETKLAMSVKFANQLAVKCRIKVAQWLVQSTLPRILLKSSEKSFSGSICRWLANKRTLFSKRNFHDEVWSSFKFKYFLMFNEHRKLITV